MNYLILYIFIILLLFIIIYLLLDKKRYKNHDDNNDISNKFNNLETYIDQLSKSSESTTTEVARLHTLLTGSTSAQGKLGENSCEKVLQNAGLIKNSTYYTQHKVQDFKLDFLVTLPNDRKIIIDSKVSVGDFSNYLNESSENNKKNYLKKHSDAVRSHIKELGKYRGIFPDDGLDLTIMYMPREEMFISACSEGLLDDALRNKVAIVGPTTLIAVIQIIQKSWSSHKQNKNTGELIKAASLIYEDAARVGDIILSIHKNYANLSKDVSSGLIRTKKLVKKIEDFRIMGGLEPKKDVSSLLKDLDKD